MGPAGGGSRLKKGIRDRVTSEMRWRDGSLVYDHDWTDILESEASSLVGTPRIFAGNLSILVMQDGGQVRMDQLYL